MTWGLQKSRDGQVWPRGAGQAGRASGSTWPPPRQPHSEDEGGPCGFQVRKQAEMEALV